MRLHVCACLCRGSEVTHSAEANEQQMLPLIRRNDHISNN